MNQIVQVREMIITNEFQEFFNSVNQSVKNKIAYVLQIIRTQKVVAEKFVKKLQNTEFYEMRISVGFNQYRSILLAIDHENLQEATQVLVLNSFLKKDNNDYKKAVEKARTILNNSENGNNK